MRTDRDRAGKAQATSVRSRAGPCSPSSAAAVLASRAEMPIRIAPVTSFNSAQRPVSSSSSSQRASCFGSSVLPSVRSVVTTSARVGGGGLLWPVTACFSPPSTRIARGGEGSGVGGASARTAASVIAAPPPIPDPSPPLRGGRGAARSCASATSAPPSPRGRRHNHRTARTARDRCGRRSGRGSGPALACLNDSAPVSAASA